MSLIRLLMVGQSVVREKHTLGRYQMAEEGFLPKFGSPTPLWSKASQDPIEGASQIDRGTEIIPVGRSGERVAGAMAWKIKAHEKAHHQRPGGSARRKEDLPAVEASLDNVTVVRNDLSDADLQVVARKGEDLRARGFPVRLGTFRLKLVHAIWGQRTRRVFETVRSTIPFLRRTHAR
jgi:hypothetical protein